MHNGREWFWRDYSQFVRAVLAAGPNVLDVGTPEAFRKELALIDLPTPGPRILTVDYPGNGDSDAAVFADAARLPFRDASFDGVICKDVMEHVRDPFATARELARVLRPGGALFVNLLNIHPYHAGAYGDYWRFTSDAVRELFPTLACDVRRGGGWAFVARAYAPAPLRRILMTRIATTLLNLIDRAIPAKNATVMFLVLGRRNLAVDS